MLLLQVPPPDPFVPAVPQNPAGAMDTKGFMDSLLADITATAGPEMWTTGMLLLRSLAAILVVWTGVRVAFEGDFRPWDLIRLVMAIAVPWGMMAFYVTPIPNTTLTFPGAIIEGGNWIQRTLIGNVATDWMDTYMELAQNMFNRGTGTDTSSGLLWMIWTGLTNISSMVIGAINTLIFQVFLMLMALILLGVYSITMAQVMWAQIAPGHSHDPGSALHSLPAHRAPQFPVLGWFKALWTYSLYGALAAAIMRVYMGISRGYINAIMGAGPGADDFWQAVAWTVALFPSLDLRLDRGIRCGEPRNPACLRWRRRRRRARRGSRGRGAEGRNEGSRIGAKQWQTKKKKKPADAGSEYAEIWGETIHANRHLRVLSIGLAVLVLLLAAGVVRLSSVAPAPADRCSRG